MPKFIYEAKAGPRDLIKGALIADNRTSAVLKIAQKGYFLLSIEEEGGFERSSSKGISLYKRISLKSITNFTRQMSDLMESGITIVKALDMLESQTPDKRLKAIIADIRGFCIDGNPLSSALARHPRIFSNLYVSMVKSGETGGALERILKRLADFNEKQLEIKTKIMAALAYPILMSIVGLITIIVLVAFVVPKMMVMFDDLGQALPLPTQILLNISNVITGYWWLIISIVAAAFISIVKIYNTKEGWLAIDRFKLGLPVLGPLIKKVEIARFSRTLATLLNNGVPVLEALRAVSESVGNAVIKEEMLKAYTVIKEGSALAKAFLNSKTIPPVVTNMIAVGEEGGHLEKSLFKVAEVYERESDEAIKIMMSLLEPVLILVLGVIVGFIVISMLLPIFEINFLAR